MDPNACPDHYLQYETHLVAQLSRITSTYGYGETIIPDSPRGYTASSPYYVHIVLTRTVHQGGRAQTKLSQSNKTIGIVASARAIGMFKLQGFLDPTDLANTLCNKAKTRKGTRRIPSRWLNHFFSNPQVIFLFVLFSIDPRNGRGWLQLYRHSIR